MALDGGDKVSVIAYPRTGRVRSRICELGPVFPVSPRLLLVAEYELLGSCPRYDVPVPDAPAPMPDAAAASAATELDTPPVAPEGAPPSVMVRSREETVGAASDALTDRLMAEWGTNAPGVL